MPLIRRIRSVEELIETYVAIGAQFDSAFNASDRRLQEPIARFAEDRTLMLCVIEDGQIRGGAIAFRTSQSAATLRAIGIDPGLRGTGIGRRLVEAIELEAMTIGLRGINLGAVDDAKGFYERLGYRGKHNWRGKQLQAPGRVLDYRLAKLRAAAGDLEEGTELTA